MHVLKGQGDSWSKNKYTGGGGEGLRDQKTSVHYESQSVPLYQRTAIALNLFD